MIIFLHSMEILDGKYEFIPRNESFLFSSVRHQHLEYPHIEALQPSCIPYTQNPPCRLLYTSYASRMSSNVCYSVYGVLGIN